MTRTWPSEVSFHTYSRTLKGEIRFIDFLCSAYFATAKLFCKADVDKCVKKWLMQCIDQGIPISGWCKEKQKTSTATRNLDMVKIPKTATNALKIDIKLFYASATVSVSVWHSCSSGRIQTKEYFQRKWNNNFLSMLTWQKCMFKEACTDGKKSKVR